MWQFIFALLLLIPVILYSIRGTHIEIATIMLIAIALSLICGLRGFDSGIDTPHYVYFFELISEGKSEYVYGVEETFKKISELLMYINDSPTFVFLVCSFITNILIFITFVKYKSSASVSVMVLFYLCDFYMHTFNIMRQMCGVAVVFYGFYYFFNKQLTKFVIGILAAMSFHLSACISLIAIVLDFSYLKRRKILLFLVISGITILAYLLVPRLKSGYLHYFDDIQLSLGFGLLIKLIFFLISFITLIYNFKIKEELPLRKQFLNVSMLYFVGIVLSFIGYFYPNMQRIGFYFLIFETVFYGIVFNNLKTSNIANFCFKTCIIFVQVYIFLMSIITNSMGIFQI